MTDYMSQVYPALTILAIGLVFGFFIGMLYYYPEIQNLKLKVREYINKLSHR